MLESYGVELIGANERAIRLAEDREEFGEAMRRIGLAAPQGGTVQSSTRRSRRSRTTGYPAILRPSFTLGGTGGGIAYNLEEFETLIRRGLELSPVGSVLVERSVIGWKEFELEVMRDGADNVVIVCSIENLDPMGVHTGDSITVAPAMTLTDREYQVMRDAADPDHPRDRRGGGRLQHPVRGQSRQRREARDRDEPAGLALVGARVQGDGLSHRPHRRQGRGRLPAGRDAERHHQDDAGLVRAGARLRRGEDPALRVREVPAADPTLTTQMKSVGEAMAIGRTFKEAFQKGLRGLEIGPAGWVNGATPADDRLQDETLETLRWRRCGSRRPSGSSRSSAPSSSAHRSRIAERTGIDPGSCSRCEELVEAEAEWQRRAAGAVGCGGGRRAPAPLRR